MLPRPSTVYAVPEESPHRGTETPVCDMATFERRLCRRNRILGGGSEGGRSPPPSGSARLHADRAVQTYRLAVQHRVLHDVQGEGRVLGRSAEPGREGDLLAE